MGGAGGGGLVIPDGGIVATPGVWSWIPVVGSQCASGSTAGIGVNLGPAGDDLFIFVMGGGACWNQGTCVPSLLQYGPICYYNPNLCVLDAAGGTKPTAANVLGDPFPRDGGGVFPGELAQISGSALLQRSEATNPFRNASFVFVPYCTGDLHSGDATRTFQTQYQAFGPILNASVHFAGATNMDLYLARIAATLPNLKRIWLTGISAGGYGATLNYDRVARKFGNAEVHLLADSAPMLNTPLHWTQWRDTWNMQMPQGCTTCDAGFPQIVDFLGTKYADRRLALLATEADQVITWFFFGGTGPSEFATPPYATYAAALNPLLAQYDAKANTRYFVVPGMEHVIIGGYGVVQADGGVTAARKSRDGGTDLKVWIDAWATGVDAGWKSTR